MKKLLQRELYIALHGQSAKFRTVKWIIILLIVTFIYRFHGWSGVTWFIILGAILGIGLHFLLRWKTKSWTKPWGPMKKRIRTPYD